MPEIDDEKYWSGFRQALMLDPTVTYLNNGSLGPCPRVVFETVTGYMARFQSQPFYQQREFLSLIRASKENLGAYVGADPDDFAMVMNLTIGMNMVVHGLELEPGAEILSTDQEYGAVNNCWAYVAEQKGWTIRRVSLPAPPESPEQIVELIAENITPQTRVLLISHISCQTGLITPAKALATLARERGILSIFDGAHVPGMIPLDIQDIDPDFYIGNCHKWLMAPVGTAFLYARPDVQEQLKPSTIGWGLSRETGTSYMHRLFEYLGSRDPSPFAGVGAAVDFQRDIGIDHIAARGRHLSAYLRRALQQRWLDVQFLSAADPALAGSITAFTLPLSDEKNILKMLWDTYRIQIIGGKMKDSNRFRYRISTHYYNTPDDIDRFLDALHEISPSG